MGTAPVTVVIRNPPEPHRTWEGLFSVGTGATDSLVPSDSPQAPPKVTQSWQSHDLPMRKCPGEGLALYGSEGGAGPEGRRFVCRRLPYYHLHPPPLASPGLKRKRFITNHRETVTSSPK